MQFSLVDVKKIDSECLEESDFEIERDRIQARISFIEKSGGLTMPIICYPVGRDENGEEMFEAFEEENNLLNTLAMMQLNRDNPRLWEMTNAWVLPDIDAAEIAAGQYLLISLGE